ncbi:aminotransferase class IV family protein [Sulfurovum sp.]|uniref:aminotransferase class IV family protein n=1 Tax=Sulfurovum sp. TaxID=1969726 RepID=UPI0025D513B7|nr:aminotransferase class IV family protein [Sulfurovum sp.]
MHSSLLLETIKAEDGEILNLPYHQKRCNQSRSSLLGTQDTLDLSLLIKPPRKGLYRCRVIYDTHIRHIEYLPYIPKAIHSLRVVSSALDYSYKYADRTGFTMLLEENRDVDEIIIEKEGLLTDTTISNIAFYDGKIWVTPQTPLLHGTMRAKLLDEGFLTAKDITKEALPGYTQVALMNAMIGFKILNHFNIQT